MKKEDKKTNEDLAIEVLDITAGKFMLRWDRQDFQESHPRLFKTIIQSMLTFASQSKPQEIEWLSEKQMLDGIYPAINGLYGADCGESFVRGCKFTQSELQTRIKPVDTKTVDAVELLKWIEDYRTNTPEGFDPDRILLCDSGWYWENDQDGECQLTPQKIVDLYKQDIESKSKSLSE